MPPRARRWPACTRSRAATEGRRTCTATRRTRPHGQRARSRLAAGRRTRRRRPTGPARPNPNHTAGTRRSRSQTRGAGTSAPRLTSARPDRQGWRARTFGCAGAAERATSHSKTPGHGEVPHDDRKAPRATSTDGAGISQGADPVSMRAMAKAQYLTGPDLPIARSDGAPDREAEALDAYSQVVTSVAERLMPSVASLRVTRRVRGG